MRRTAASDERPLPEPPVESRPTGSQRAVVGAIALVDVVGALAAESLLGNIYLFDNNRIDGSTGNGSTSLRTPLSVGDVIVWTSVPLETEAFVRIDDVIIDEVHADRVALDCGVFTETTVVYWTIRILKPLDADIPYRLAFSLGSAPDPVVLPAVSYLARGEGDDAVPSGGAL